MTVEENQNSSTKEIIAGLLSLIFDGFEKYTNFE